MSAAAEFDPAAESTAPIFSADLWPHRSLSHKGFAAVIAIAATGFAIPLLAMLHSGGFWVIASFCLAGLGLLVLLIRLTYRSGRLRETISIWPDRLRVDRIEPDGARKSWEANPYWVQVRLHSTQRVEDYLVLSSAGREVELGAFLTPEERRALAEELNLALAKAARTR